MYFLPEVPEPRDLVHGEYLQVHHLEIHPGRRSMDEHLGAARRLVVVHPERAHDLAPFPRFRHDHAAADRATVVRANLDAHGVAAPVRRPRALQADPPGHAVRDFGRRRARELPAEAVPLAGTVRRQHVPPAGPRPGLVGVVFRSGQRMRRWRLRRRVVVHGQCAGARRGPAGHCQAA
ncbi:Os01g0134850, partial [Oryza sativa Japonica Group]